MSDLFPVTTKEAIAELERELKLRRSVYPKFIDRGTLSKARADRQIAIVETIVEWLRQNPMEKPPRHASGSCDG